ncbi:hypothetical protein [Streptomyces sp. NRRL F-5123]|uniref:hypothetical protein n=1 Tax=Streptomyces sp. NRRL F-5123 TaxID=1463856 RepID=UPI000694509E|nr:hypothetical protein [Streptomyces sp. NRRL F-5123]
MTFEDRLMTELMNDSGWETQEPPVEARRRPLHRSRVVWGATAAAAATAVAAVVVVAGPADTPAYAVTKNPDGTVILRLNEVGLDRAAQKPLTAKLRAAGIQVVVDTVPAGKACAEDRGRAVNNLWKREGRSAMTATLKPGDTLALTYSRTKSSSAGAVSLFSGPVSRCRLVDDGVTDGGTVPFSQLRAGSPSTADAAG